MLSQMLCGLLLPLAGTTVGAAAVFFLREQLNEGLRQGLNGFAGGVMTAASVWSLLLPSLERSAHPGRWFFLPAAGGFLAGTVLLLLLDRLLQPLERELEKKGICSPTLLLAVALHNLPEGMAVGTVLAAADGSASAAVAALSLGIALQNIPEGAILSLPLRAGGMGKGRAFLLGAASGMVEPLGAGLTLLLARVMIPLLPYLLSLSAGAMIFVVTQELIPQLRSSRYADTGTICFAVGFTLMMALDAALSR